MKMKTEIDSTENNDVKSSRSRTPFFARYAWFVLGYNILVVLWGAYVRATNSGAGCGGHWPSCNGVVIPDTSSIHTLIEYTHRVSVAFCFVALAGLIYGAFRCYPSGHRVRKASLWAVVFTLSEALIGALLVIYGLVVHNASVYRAVAMAAHLVNTFMLLGTLTIAAWWASGGKRLKLRDQGALGWGIGLALLGTMILSVSGAVTALGDTLFPSHSLLQGIQQDFSPTAYFLIRLRYLHPLIAISVGLYTIFIAGLTGYLRPSDSVVKYVRVVAFVIVSQITAGFINMALLAPVWMQLVHLFLADIMWVALILLACSALSVDAPRMDVIVTEREDAKLARHSEGISHLKDYIALTKPKVISLLLFTTIAAMFIAKPQWPGLTLLLAVAIGGYMSAGAANAINMVIDRDIDAQMKRTSQRPTVTHTISARNAILFAVALEAGSFLLFTLFANLLSALLALAGLVFYVLVYTLGLKRRTWHNIVIGGAAGAFPPLVGWAAVTGQLNSFAWWLFAIIFLWTPVHFWALALLMKDDYARAGIPMLPVVRGVRMTVTQISLYAVLTALLSILPLTQGSVGIFYVIVSFLLNAVLLVRCALLYLQPGRPQALSLYKYSMLYLALLFLTIALDRVLS